MSGTPSGYRWGSGWSAGLVGEDEPLAADLAALLQLGDQAGGGLEGDCLADRHADAPGGRRAGDIGEDLRGRLAEEDLVAPGERGVEELGGARVDIEEHAGP